MSESKLKLKEKMQDETNNGYLEILIRISLKCDVTLIPLREVRRYSRFASSVLPFFFYFSFLKNRRRGKYPKRET